MGKRRNIKQPEWINVLLYSVSIIALMAVLTVAVQGWRKGVAHHRKDIPDIIINLNGSPVREHCTTCHWHESQNVNGVAISQQDHHPDIFPHSIENLGCTACHLGEGMALDEEISHGLPGLGARTVLKGRDLQATCYTCHELKPLKGAENAWDGYQLYQKKACNTCHDLAGMTTVGRYGPDLSHIGSYLGLKQLNEAIRDPKKDPPNSTMPRFPLSSRLAQGISYFLKSRVKAPFFTTPMMMQSGKITLPDLATSMHEKSLPTGDRLLDAKKCTGCHKFKKKDGGIAPDLTYIGHMRKDQYIIDFITRPAWKIPGAIMPKLQ